MFSPPGGYVSDFRFQAIREYIRGLAEEIFGNRCVAISGILCVYFVPCFWDSGRRCGTCVRSGRSRRTRCRTACAWCSGTHPLRTSCPGCTSGRGSACTWVVDIQSHRKVSWQKLQLCSQIAVKLPTELNRVPARPLRGASVEPPRQRLDALLLLAALLVIAAPLRHGLARVVVSKIPVCQFSKKIFSLSLRSLKV